MTVASRFLTAVQRRHIVQVIRDGHLAFLAEMFGPTAIDRDDYVRLLSAGKIREERMTTQDAARSAHMLGAVIVGGGHGAVEHLRPAPRDAHVMTEDERAAIAIVKERIGQHVRGLGNKLEAATGHVLVDADQKLRRSKLTSLQRETARGVEERAAADEVARRVRDATKDLKREWLRVVHTEMHNAIEESKAVTLAGGHPSRDPRVFKRPRPDACAFCKMLYLRPDGVTPRVFKLSDLLANGDNVDRKAGRPTRSGKSRTEWKAVVGAVHPFCQCPMEVLPQGMSFDSGGKMVYVGARKSIDVESVDKNLIHHDCTEE